MLNALRIERDRLAMEASLSMNLTGLLKDTFPAIMAGFTSFVARFAPDAPAVQLTRKQSEFVRELNKHAYLDIAPLTAYVPEGLNVTYLEYLGHLPGAASHAADVLKHLSSYSTYLSQLITNSEQKLSSTSLTREFTGWERERMEHNKALGACFALGSTRTERTIGDVVNRNSDWSPVFHRSDELTKTINAIDRSVLTKKVNECAGLLETIMTKIDRGDFEGVSPQAITNLSDGAYNVASELEFFVATYYKVSALAESINRTVEHFHKAMDK